MNPKELTKTFMMILNWKKPVIFMVYIKIFKVKRVYLSKQQLSSLSTSKQ